MAAPRGTAHPLQRLSAHGDILTARATTGVALAAATAAVVALHVLRPDLPPASSRLSAYATGRHGWVMTFAFLALAVAVLAFGVSLWRQSRAVAVLSAVAGAGLVLSAAYPTGVSASAETLHSVASTAATVTLAALLVVESLWPSAASHRTLFPRLLAAAAVVAALANPWLHDTAYSGLGQRALWLLLVAWLTAAVARGQPADQPPARRAARHSKIKQYT